MFASFSFIRTTYLILWIFLLGGCAKTEQLSSAKPLFKAKQYTLSVNEYLTLAASETGAVKQDLLIKAAAKAIQEGRQRQASAILAQTENLTTIQNQQKTILQASLDIREGRIATGKSKLVALEKAESVPEDYQSRLHLSLAEAWQKTGHHAESIQARIDADTAIQDEHEARENRLALWSTLMRLPPEERNKLHANTSNTLLKGWAALALIPFNHSGQKESIITAIQKWQADFPQHPANQILPDVPKHKLESELHQIALLLPLTGSLSGPGLAIRDGFMQARKQSATLSEVDIRIYDTATKPAPERYEEALREGADYIIGPLGKQDVAKVAAMTHPVPTLLLNEIEQETGENVYQFGLSLTSEAQQIAKKAAARGFTRALILAPDSWGKETVTAFTRQWEALGGEVAGKLLYKNGKELATGIRDILQVSDSESRVKTLQKILQKNFEARLSRRMDVDMIFLLSYPSTARQIMPMLRYYYAGNIPVYATSTVYAGTPDRMRDKDLNGIIFCDMPGMFSLAQAPKIWPEQLNSYNRLHALGMDSFAVIAGLNQWKIFPALVANNQNGLLSLNPSGKITRDLAWGFFQGGQVRLLEGG